MLLLVAVMVVLTFVRRFRVAQSPLTWQIATYAIGGVAAYWTIPPSYGTAMLLHRFRFVLIGLVAAAALGACRESTEGHSVPVGVMPIAEARARRTGDVVHVEGTVTVQSGAFASSIASGFALQDETAGIFVLDAHHEFGLGTRLRLTGRRGVTSGLQHIALQVVEPLDGSGAVVPRPVATGSLGNDLEGLLIRVSGRVMHEQDDAAYGYKAFVDDGSGPCQVFLDASTGLTQEATRWRIGDHLQVTGFAGRYNETDEIMPRVSSDIVKLAEMP